MKLHRLTAWFCLIAVCGVGRAEGDAAASCGVLYPPPATIQAARIVLFGEVHGTQEVPQVLGSHVCSLVEGGSRVTLVVEISANEQERIDAYLRSRGGMSDRAALLQGAFWTRPRRDGKSIQDGRASQAMLQLLERARQLAQSTGRLRIVAAAAFRGGQDTDAMMASAIRGAMQDGGSGSVVALMGGVHASGARGVPWNQEYEGVGYRLRDLNPLIVEFQYAGGSAWICTNDGCGEQSISEAPAYRNRTPGYGPSTRPGFAWSMLLGRVTASSPAVAE